MRYASNVKLKYHGLQEIRHCATSKAVAALKALWFLDGHGKDREAAIQVVLQQFPLLANKSWLAIDKTPLQGLFARNVSPAGSPSSGWAGAFAGSRPSLPLWPLSFSAFPPYSCLPLRLDCSYRFLCV